MSVYWTLREEAGLEPGETFDCVSVPISAELYDTAMSNGMTSNQIEAAFEHLANEGLVSFRRNPHGSGLLAVLDGSTERKKTEFVYDDYGCIVDIQLISFSDELDWHLKSLGKK